MCVIHSYYELILYIHGYIVDYNMELNNLIMCWNLFCFVGSGHEHHITALVYCIWICVPCYPPPLIYIAFDQILSSKTWVDMFNTCTYHDILIIPHTYKYLFVRYIGI